MGSLTASFTVRLKPSHGLQPVFHIRLCFEFMKVTFVLGSEASYLLTLHVKKEHVKKTTLDMRHESIGLGTISL